MKFTNETDALNETIEQLQNKQLWELKLLKAQFYITYESIKPMNLIKHAVTEVTTMPDLKNNLLNNVVGLTTGFLSKKLLIGSSHNPIKKILGSLVQFAIANVVSKRSNFDKTLSNHSPSSVNGRKH